MAAHSMTSNPSPSTSQHETTTSVDLSNLPSDITVLVSSSAVLPTCPSLTPATLILSPTTGKILAIHPFILSSSSFPPDTPYVDHTPHVLLPGLVDAHVHLNEPGRTEWEGFWTGTRAAAFGGVTTVIDMPLNAIPPTTTVAGLKEKVEAARGKCWVDVGFYGGVVPGNEGELIGLVEGGVRGFKGFLIDSGVPEFPAITPADIETAMRTLRDTPTTLMFHAEMIPTTSSTDTAPSPELLTPNGPSTTYTSFLSSRPPLLETTAVSQILSLAAQSPPLAPNLHLHIVHLSAVEVIPLLRAARKSGVNITAETCFHYLALTAEEVGTGDTRVKCCPPIRGWGNREGLWKELLKCKFGEEEGVIKTIVSDHSPCTAGLKILPPSIAGHGREADALAPSPGVAPCHPPYPPTSADGVEDGDFFRSWGGISSVGLGLPILWSQKFPHLQSHSDAHIPATPREFTLHDIVHWCATNTAAQVGLSHLKGSLKAGLDADVIVFDDESEWTLGVERMLFRNKCSPYEGRRFRGVVRETWVRGKRVFVRDGDGVEGGSRSGFDEEGGPRGRLILGKRTK